MSKFDELILVVNRETIFNNEHNAFNGFIDIHDDRYQEIINTFHHYEVKRRGDMEEDPSYKQLISYVIIEDKDDVLVYKRLDGGGESRLHGLQSIGVGGHMNDTQGQSIINTLNENASRELEEEIGLSEADIENIQIIGLINDDENEVGKVHIGLVFKATTSKDSVYNKEADTISLEWVDKQRLKEQTPLESWSALIVRDYYER